MTDLKTSLGLAIEQTLAADLAPLSNFLLSNSPEPLIATGSGGAKTAAVSIESPENPGGIDKRVPISISFKEVLKKNGPLTV